MQADGAFPAVDRQRYKMRRGKLVHVGPTIEIETATKEDDRIYKAYQRDLKRKHAHQQKCSVCKERQRVLNAVEDYFVKTEHKYAFEWEE